MSLEVFLHPRAKKALDRMGGENAKRVLKKIQTLESSPERRGKRIHPSELWVLRVGEYRVIYRIDKENGKVFVPFIGHRRNVYDDFSRLL